MKNILLTCICICIVALTCGQVVDTLHVRDTISEEIIHELPAIALDEEEDNVSAVLTAGRDPFLSAATFNFLSMRFRLRGYPNGDAVYLNGADFTGLDNGFTPFSFWSGLTNVMRAKQNAYGLGPAGFTIGNIGLNTNIDMRAGAQWTQTQVGYAITNRNYRYRILLTHGSGFNKKGWSYSYMLSPRYAAEGYVPGTYYKSISYYAAVDKKLDTKRTISFITFGAPTENGRQAASVQEAMDLSGTNFYNPSWGWQKGKKRSSNVAVAVQPVFMGVYEYKPDHNSNWTTTVAYVFGKRKISGFDWYNTADPRPDYYRYLPGYYNTNDPSRAAAVRAAIIANPDLLQVNWLKLYEANRHNHAIVSNVNGVAGNNVSGKRAVYILSDRVNSLQRYIINTGYNTKINNRLSISAGADYQQQNNQYYTEVKDLLGADFWVNVNQYAESDNPADPDILQYDIDKPNQLKKEGDQYGYNYKMTVCKGMAWGQLVLTLKRLDLFIRGGLTYSVFHRTGLNRNGLYPADSYGASIRQQFMNPVAKSGITYKLDGRNYFYINAGYFSRPPYPDNVYVSPRTRNTLQSNNLKSEITTSIESGYRLNSPRVKISLAGYYTRNKNAYDVLTFYHDQYRSFVNYALSGINTIYFGGELGAEIKLSSILAFNIAAAVGRYYYDSRPHAVVTADNTAKILSEHTVYWQYYRVPSTPQNAYCAGLFYRSPKSWYASLSGNYFSNTWLSINPLRRTADVLGNVNPVQPDVQQVISSVVAQERFKDQFTLDFFGGWTKRLSNKYSIHNKPVHLVFSLGINNLLNNTGIRSGGFEQLRFDVQDRDTEKFPPKYYYTYGLNYYAMLAFRFH